MELWLKVCLSFIKIGAFSFGGGYAVLSFIQQEVVEGNNWILPEDFVDIVAIAGMTPGPIAVNSSTFVGYNLFGPVGGLVCTLCVILVPFSLALLVSVYFTKFKENRIVKNALNGIRPAVIGLIATSCFSIGKISFVDGYSILFFAIAFFLVYKIKVNPIITLMLSGMLGAVLFEVVLPILETA
ncbi:chromate transporter [Sinanaerobacter sp. ZZT-01]|uniref:chromate transporter n=1 Tax=Sinanaerobacter sp. ZZT-01 TaxID=3111540 RepID=UPI002D7985F0|nr:chromate transporter [Sinanaerobacter sp. ZZT-01]WRR94689.1 chromate transporter [Sinanaerobacter sp. ZZT-01]